MNPINYPVNNDATSDSEDDLVSAFKWFWLEEIINSINNIKIIFHF